VYIIEMYSTVLTAAMLAAILGTDATSTPALAPAPSHPIVQDGGWVSAIIPVIPGVPFYSQFKDIDSPKWQKAGCGITSLAMMIEYYKPDTVDLNQLLQEGLDADAFSTKAGGWTYAGLIEVAQKYGLSGDAYDYAGSSSKAALAEMRKSLSEGPVIASIHYKFQPKNKISHLIVVNGIDGDNLYYNDPASKEGGLSIPLKTFLAAWKNRFIVLRPVDGTTRVAIR
jgi:predicted double-glycine peptidase